MPVIANGIGEKLTEALLPWSSGVVIVNPLKPVSTPHVFTGFGEFRQQSNMPPFDVALSNPVKMVEDINTLNLLTANSLEDPAKVLCPEILEIERFLKQNSQAEMVRMSGSGASVIALYHNRDAAKAVAQRVRDKRPDWWVMADEIAP